MSSPTRLTAANAMLRPGKALRAFLDDPAVASACRSIRVDWTRGRLTGAPANALAALNGIGALSETEPNALTEIGVRVLGRLQVDLQRAVKKSALRRKYEVLDTIGHGSTSIAIKAVHRLVKSTVVLKVLRPALPQTAEHAIRSLGALEGIDRLVAPIDSHLLTTTTTAGDKVGLYCIVFPFVQAITLQDYFRKRPPVTPFFFDELVRQVGGVLNAIEARGLSHGDLHGGNVLVRTETPRLEFSVIDPSPGLGVGTPFGRVMTDFEWFKEHIAAALLSLQRHLSTMSLQKHLGPRLFSALRTLVGAEAMKFATVLRLFETGGDSAYVRWQQDRDAFVAQKFVQPRPLGLLRWEEIANPAEAVELFEPYEPLFRRIRAFGNSLIVGARGSGKSTYLAALAYFPGSARKVVYPNEIVGVLFSCRQGEFKQFSAEFLSFSPLTRNEVKHVFVLKIIRRLLAVVGEGCRREELSSGDSMTPLYEFVQTYMNEQVSIPLVDTSATAAIGNLAAGVVRWEEFEIRRLFADAGRASRYRLDESSLLRFCQLVRELIPALTTTRFYFLFDDAGEPNIPAEAQQILNDLVTSSNSVYCVKLSAERFSYRLRDSSDRTLEETHDITSFDMASTYATGAGIAESATKEYFEKILARRLDYWHYGSRDIATYLGQRQEEDGHAVSVKELIGRLAQRRKNAYYAGWEVIWRLADKTARSLIELVSEIFERSGARPADGRAGEHDNGPLLIKALVQDRAVRDVSNRRLRSLEFVPGEIEVGGIKMPIGRQLYGCASAFGSVSFRYLSSKVRRTKRVDEFLAIERNDANVLRSDAQHILELLVRYGVFDDSALTVAFDDKQKKPVYVLNRIFCPAFQISFRRDQHLRLGSERLQTFLLKPEQFAREGTSFLRELSEGSLLE